MNFRKLNLTKLLSDISFAHFENCGLNQNVALG